MNSHRASKSFDLKIFSRANPCPFVTDMEDLVTYGALKVEWKMCGFFPFGALSNDKHLE